MIIYLPNEIVMNLCKFIVRKWILLRMAAQEFYFKQPFEIAEEYPIMKSILVLDMFPIELIFIFVYARIYGSLSSVTVPLFLIFLIINILLANLIINSLKGKPIITEAMSSYQQMDYSNRKKLYSFKNITEIILLTARLPWLIMGIAIAIICFSVPI